MNLVKVPSEVIQCRLDCATDQQLRTTGWRGAYLLVVEVIRCKSKESRQLTV
jgi:hypothetical protein